MPKPPPAAFVGAFNMMLARPGAAPQLARFQAAPVMVAPAPAMVTPAPIGVSYMPPKSTADQPDFHRPDRWTLLATTNTGAPECTKLGPKAPGGGRYAQDPVCMGLSTSPIEPRGNQTMAVQFLEPMRIDTMVWDSGPAPGAQLVKLKIGNTSLLPSDLGLVLVKFGVPYTLIDKIKKSTGVWPTPFWVPAYSIQWMGALDAAGYHDAARFIRSLRTRGDLSILVHDEYAPVSQQIIFSVYNGSDAPLTALSFRLTGSLSAGPKPKFG